MPEYNKNSTPILTSLLASFLKAFFYLLYHQFAWAYNYVAATVSLGLWHQWGLAVLPHIYGSTLLELGHGPGELQIKLLAHGKAAYAIDESWQMNRIAMQKLRSQSLQSSIVNGYAQFLPFPEHCFDHVVATFPTEYIFLPATLTEVKRVLVSGGSLVIIPVAVLIGNALPVKAIRLLHRITGQAPASLDPHTVAEIIRPIKRAGFRITSHTVQVKSSQVLVVVAHLDSGI